MSGKASGALTTRPKAEAKAKPAVKVKAKKISTTVKAENLAELGVSVLADLLIELADDARIKRRLRYELLAAAGGEGLAAELGKRLDTIAKAGSFIDSPKLREFARDLDVQRRMIAERVAQSNPTLALELMVRFLGLAQPIARRVYEIDGLVGAVFRKGCDALGELALAAKMPAGTLAKQVFDLVVEDSFGFFDAIISQAAPALGQEGQQALRALLTSALRQRPAKKGYAYDSKAYILTRALMELADIAGDPDAFIACIPQSERQEPRNGAQIARRLLSAGRTNEAIAALEASSPYRPNKPAMSLRIVYMRDLRGAPPETWDDVHLDALEAASRREEAQALRWSSFKSSLSIPRLRAYLKALPDFDDVVAEDEAVAFAAQFKPFQSALSFLIEWPNLSAAARLVEARAAEINGDDYELLVPAARRLEGAYPMAATLLLRAMIVYALKQGISARYKHAAKHLLECESLAALLPIAGEISSHADFVADLRAQHGRKYGFKSELEALGGVF